MSRIDVTCDVYPYTAGSFGLASMLPHRAHEGGSEKLFERLGKYVREERILTLENAIRNMTSLPARKLGLKDRGLIKGGIYADIMIFNPETVIDKATYVEPRQDAEGIEYVLVNGEVTIEGNEHTEASAGKALRKLCET